MGLDEFRKLCQREVNKTIAIYQGFICDDRWEYNQNAMRDGKSSVHYGNLSLIKRGEDKFHVIGWNPFNSNGDAFKLMVDFGMYNLDFDGKDTREAREEVIYRAYQIADAHLKATAKRILIQTGDVEKEFELRENKPCERLG